MAGLLGGADRLTRPVVLSFFCGAAGLVWLL
jgi:hypothetical protein